MKYEEMKRGLATGSSYEPKDETINPRTISPVDSSVDALANSIAVLKGGIEELYSRLKPVLSPMSNGEAHNTEGAKRVSCALASTIDNQTEFVHGLVIDVRDILSRLEI